MESSSREEMGDLCGKVGTMRTCECTDDNVRSTRKCGDFMPDEVSKLPAHSVSDHRIPHGLTNDKTRPGSRGLRAGDVRKHQVCRCETTSPSHHMPEIGRCAQPVRLREHSDCDLVAALAAACREDGTTGARAHAQAETVLLVALAVVRLEGALHVVLRKVFGKRRRWPSKSKRYGIPRLLVKTRCARNTHRFGVDGPFGPPILWISLVSPHKGRLGSMR